MKSTSIPRRLIGGLLVLVGAAACAGTSSSQTIAEPPAAQAPEPTAVAPPTAVEEARDEPDVDPPSSSLTTLLSFASEPDGLIEQLRVVDFPATVNAAGESRELCSLVGADGDTRLLQGLLGRPHNLVRTGYHVNIGIAEDLPRSFGFRPCEIEATLTSYADSPGSFSQQQEVMLVNTSIDQVVQAAMADGPWAERLSVSEVGTYTVLDWGDERHLEDRNGARMTGNGGQLVVQNGIVARTNSSDLLDRLLDEDRPRIIDRPYMSEAVAELERRGAFGVVISEQLPVSPRANHAPLPPGVPPHEPWQLLVGAGTQTPDGEDQAVLVLAYTSQEQAAKNGAAFRDLFDAAYELSETQDVGSLATVVDAAEIEIIGSMLVVTFVSRDGSVPPIANLGPYIFHGGPLLGSSAAG